MCNSGSKTGMSRTFSFGSCQNKRTQQLKWMIICRPLVWNVVAFDFTQRLMERTWGRVSSSGTFFTPTHVSCVPVSILASLLLFITFTCLIKCSSYRINGLNVKQVFFLVKSIYDLFHSKGYMMSQWQRCFSNLFNAMQISVWLSSENNFP